MDTLIIIGSILVVSGIIGSVVPVLPGPALGFLGLLLLFFSEKAESVPVMSLIIFGAGFLILTVIDYLAPILGARYFGSSKKGLFGAIIGALLGMIFFPPLGIFLGAFLGAITGEYYSGKKFEEALRAGVGVIFGSVSAIVLQILFSIILAVYFFSKVF